MGERSAAPEARIEEAKGGARGRLALVSLIATLQVISMLMMRQIAPLYLERIGASAGMIGAVVASFAALPLLISLPSGVVMDRLGYRSMVFFGAGTMVVASLMLATLPPVPLVFITQLLAGLANILVILATQAYVSNLGRPEERTANFAIYSLSFGLGFLIGPPVAGIVEDLWGYSAAFVGAGLVSALVLLLTTRLPEVTPSAGGFRPLALGRAIKEEVPDIVALGGNLLRKPLVQLAVGVSVVVLFIMTLRASFYLVYLENLGFSTTRIGILVAVQEGFALVFRPFLAPLMKRAGAIRILVVSLFIGGVGIGLTAVFTTFGLLLVAAALHGITPAFSQPISMIMMSASSPGESQGTAMGLRQSFNQAPLFVGPLVFGGIAAYLGLRAVFAVAAVILVAASFLLLALRDRIEGPSELTAGSG